MPELLPFWAALSVIGLAELGDKTQLLSFGFAAKYPVWEVISAVSAASALLMALAVIFGGLLNRFIPLNVLTILAGGFFILFGIITLVQKEKEEEIGSDNKKNPFLIVFTGFLLAELGDKTQLATLAISAQYGSPVLVWLGATLAMIAVNCLGIAAGGWIRKHIPAFYLRLVSASVFIIFGILTLLDAFVW